MTADRHELRALADATHKAAIEEARAQFRAEKDAIDREFDKVFDDARDAGFVTLDEIKRLRDRPRPSYAEIEVLLAARIAAADNILNLAICAIFNRKP
jgi:hypothetical protein